MPDNDAAEKTVGALDLEDIAYEREPLRVTILGERYVFMVWVRGPGCPARIGAEFERLRVKMVRGLTSDHGGAYQEFLPDALRTIFEAPISQYDAIDLLAGDVERAEKILNHFRWRSEDADAGPEARSEGEQTTPPSLLTSSGATAAPDPTAAAG